MRDNALWYRGGGPQRVFPEASVESAESLSHGLAGDRESSRCSFVVQQSSYPEDLFKMFNIRALASSSGKNKNSKNDGCLKE